MSELSTLTAQRDELLAKIREIEESCEGIENENNAKCVQELNLQQAQLTAQKNELSAQLSAVQSKLTGIANEITQLSGTGIDRILEAIKNQRWYFFKNETKVLLDKTTGLLWANLEYFPYCDEANGNGRYAYNYINSNHSKIINDYDFGKFSSFRVPDCYELWNMIFDKTFPFLYSINSSDWYIKGYHAWAVIYNGNFRAKNLYYSSATDNISYDSMCLLPCSDTLVKNSDYKNNVSPDNPNYTEKERLQFTLDLFVQNELWPIFDDDEITQLYKKIYFEKPRLLEQLQELQTQIESLQTVTLLSSEFDYTALLAKYDIKAIDNSIIKYYQAIQQWTDELMEKLDYYEQKKESAIYDFNAVCLPLSKKYEYNAVLSDSENDLLKQRQNYFRKKFTLGMTGVKSKILAVKKQADDLEQRIDDIDSGSNAIADLAKLEKEERASFSFIAENTAKIICNALKKIEYFEANRQFVVNAVSILQKWSNDYIAFKTKQSENGENQADKYADWQKIRYNIESKIQPLIEHELKGGFAAEKEDEITVSEQIIAELELYKSNIDQFFAEECKEIKSNGIQYKFDVQCGLYKYTSQLQAALGQIIFNCTRFEDKIFIMNWLAGLSNLQFDEILNIAAENGQNISNETIEKFEKLKHKNYDICLMDAKTYDDENKEREKLFDSLTIEMREGLAYSK